MENIIFKNIPDGVAYNVLYLIVPLMQIVVAFVLKDTSIYLMNLITCASILYDVSTRFHTLDSYTSRSHMIWIAIMFGFMAVASLIIVFLQVALLKNPVPDFCVLFYTPILVASVFSVWDLIGIIRCSNPKGDR